MKTLNLRRKRLVGKREIIVTVAAIILATAGIKASDKILNRNGGEVTNGEKGCPPDMVQVLSENGGFCIDKYENSAGDNCQAKNPQSQGESLANLDESDCRPASVSGALPWRNISQNQAAVACAKAGKRLPTNKEWLAAALGTPDKASGWGPDDCNVNNNWGNQPGETGSGKNCISSAGAYDMIGNAWEWVEGTVADGAYQGRAFPKEGYIKGVDENALPSATGQDKGDPNYNNDYMWMINTGTRAFARGGYWGNGSDAGIYSVYLDSEPSFAGIGIGFRCVK